MKRGTIGIIIERILFGWGVLAIAVPLTIRTMMMTTEHGLHIGIYDPNIGGDPILRTGDLRAGDLLFLVIYATQLFSLLIRGKTVAGTSNRLRWIFAYAGLTVACLTNRARLLPKLLPDSVVLAGGSLTLLLLLAAIATRRPRASGSEAPTSQPLA